MFGDPIRNEKGWKVKKWEEVLKTTPIMKTTYKIKKEEVLPGSYLDQLLQGKLKE